MCKEIQPGQIRHAIVNLRLLVVRIVCQKCIRISFSFYQTAKKEYRTAGKQWRKIEMLAEGCGKWQNKTVQQML